MKKTSSFVTQGKFTETCIDIFLFSNVCMKNLLLNVKRQLIKMTAFSFLWRNPHYYRASLYTVSVLHWCLQTFSLIIIEYFFVECKTRQIEARCLNSWVSNVNFWNVSLNHVYSSLSSLILLIRSFCGTTAWTVKENV